MGHEHTANKETHKLRVHTKLVVVEERPPHIIVKRFGCTTIHKKRYINASFIHSFIHDKHENTQPVKNTRWRATQTKTKQEKENKDNERTRTEEHT